MQKEILEEQTILSEDDFSEDILLAKCPYSDFDDCLCRNLLDKTTGERGENCVALENTRFSKNGKKIPCPFYKNKAMDNESLKQSERVYSNYPAEVERFRAIMFKKCSEIQARQDEIIKNQSKAQERAGV